MKKLILLFVLLPIISFSQSFKEGWKEGYKKGYCGNEISCIEPIPPIPPVAPINMRKSNVSDYQFGYNEGFIAGTKAKQKKKQKEENTSKELLNNYKKGVNSYTPNYNGTRKPETTTADIDNISAQIQQAARLRAIQIEKEKLRISKIPLLSEIIEIQHECNENLSLYSDLVIITNGWQPKSNAKTIVKLLENTDFNLISKEKVKRAKKYKKKKHANQSGYLYLNFIRNAIDEKNRETTIIIKDSEDELIFKGYFRNVSHMKMLELLIL